ncbi:hypothetical protein CCACVL1_00640, partial [Corchorus capsularis]
VKAKRRVGDYLVKNCTRRKRTY